MPPHDDIKRRLIDIEVLASHQETMIRDLSDMVVQQWQTLDSLLRKVGRLEGQINEKRDSPGIESVAETPPPHY
jgi:uncharacterized coiled-coil protein SlyX